MDWLATMFYPLAVILMEAFWVSPLLNWIGNWPLFRLERPALGLVSIIIVLAVSLFTTRIVSRQNLPMRWIQAIIIGFGAIVMLLVVATEYRDGYAFLSGAWFTHTGEVLGDTFSEPGTIIVAIIAVCYLWWRGIVLGQSTTYFKDIYRSFVIGMAVLIVLIIFWKISDAITTITSPGTGLGLNVIAFFFFGLLSIAICHLYVMRSTMPKEDASLTSVWRWMPVMLGVIGGMVLIGFLIASILSPDMMENIGKGMSILGDALGTLFKWILTPIVYLFQGIAMLIVWIMKQFNRGSSGFSVNNSNIGPAWGEINTADTPAWIGEAAKWTAIIIIVAIVILIMAKSIAKYRARKTQEEIEEINESLFSWKNLKDDLKLFLKMLGDKFQRKAKPHVTPFDPDDTSRMDIREIFRHILWEGNRSGVARRPYETAAEYAYRLESAVPESVEPAGIVKESLGGIKDMYEEVRYGETALSEPRVDKANSFWQTVKSFIRRLRGE